MSELDLEARAHALRRDMLTIARACAMTGRDVRHWMTTVDAFGPLDAQATALMADVTAAVVANGGEHTAATGRVATLLAPALTAGQALKDALHDLMTATPLVMAPSGAKASGWRLSSTSYNAAALASVGTAANAVLTALDAPTVTLADAPA